MSDHDKGVAQRQEPGEAKRAYVKPACVRIRLASDEVLAAGCKNESSAGPSQSYCDGGGLGSSCSANGS